MKVTAGPAATDPDAQADTGVDRDGTTTPAAELPAHHSGTGPDTPHDDAAAATVEHAAAHRASAPTAEQPAQHTDTGPSTLHDGAATASVEYALAHRASTPTAELSPEHTGTPKDLLNGQAPRASVDQRSNAEQPAAITPRAGPEDKTAAHRAFAPTAEHARQHTGAAKNPPDDEAAPASVEHAPRTEQSRATSAHVDAAHVTAAHEPSTVTGDDSEASPKPGPSTDANVPTLGQFSHTAPADQEMKTLAAPTRRLLDGPILPTLLRLAAPNIVVVLVQVGSATVDTFFVAQLGAEALAGVALVFPAWMLMVTMSAGGIGGGIASAIARALGGGRQATANALAWHAIVIGVILAAVFSLLLLTAGPTLYGALGGSGGAWSAAVAYSTVVFSGALAVWLVNTFASVLRGSGDMVGPATVVVAGEILHVSLAPCLIFGLGPFPTLGVAGAGLSLVISYTVRAAALGAWLLRGRSTVRPVPHPRFDRTLLWDILRVGLPGSINTILTNVTVVAVTGLVGGYGTLALAGYGLGARLEYLQIPLVFGFGTALVTLVGTNIGAGNVARARRIAWTGAGLAAALTGSVGLIAAIWPHLWLGVFTSDADVLRAGESYLRFVGPTYGFFGLGLALYFASQGAGRLMWPLIAGLGRLAVAVIGGWIVLNVLGAGLVGVFATIAVSFIAFGAAQALAARAAIRGRST